MKIVLKIKSAVLHFLHVIADKIFAAITAVFTILGMAFFFGFMTKVFIVNQSIFKISAHEQQHEQHQFLILKKCLNGK